MSDKLNDDGQGLDQPILVWGEDLAIFDAGDKFLLKKKFVGTIGVIPKNASKEFWNSLKEMKWTEPVY